MRVTREVETQVKEDEWTVSDSTGSIFLETDYRAHMLLCDTDELPRLVRLLTRLNEELNGPKEDRTNG